MTLFPRSLTVLSTVSILAMGCGGLDQADTNAGMGQDGGDDASLFDDGDDGDGDGDAGMDDAAGDAGQDGGDDGDDGDDGTMAVDGDGGDGDAGGDDDDSSNGDDDDDGDGDDDSDGDDDDDDGSNDDDGGPEVCTAYTATEAITNPAVSAHSGGHAIWAPGFYCDGGTTIFGVDALTLELVGDTASISGTAYVITDGCGGAHDDVEWDIDVALAAGPDSMLPKRELIDPDTMQSTAVTDTWLYYALVEGEATMQDPNSGATATLSHRPADYTYGFQVGYTASGKNLDFGISGWFFFEHQGECGHRSGHGDFNLDLHANCQ